MPESSRIDQDGLIKVRWMCFLLFPDALGDWMIKTLLINNAEILSYIADKHDQLLVGVERS